MPNTGNLFPGTAETLQRGTAPLQWSDFANILTDNGIDATCVGTTSGSDYLVARNFGLALAAGDTVGGITIRVEASEHSGGNEILNAQLQDNTGALIGTAKTVTLSGVSKAIYTYGSTTDLWGATLTPTIVNSVNFGVRLWYTTSHTVNIDFVTGAIEYALAPVTGEGGPFPPGVFPPGVFPGPIFPGAGTGDVTDALSSVEISATVGTIVPSTHKTLPSVELTADVGFATAGSDSVGTLTGVEATANYGTVLTARTLALTGVTVSATVGSVAGSKAVTLSGVSATITVQAVAGSKTVALTGVAFSAAVGQSAVSRIQSLTTVSVQVEVGYLAAGADKVAVLTGVAVGVTAGSVLTDLAGYQNTVSVGTLSVSFAQGLTTVATTATVGFQSVADQIGISGFTAVQVVVGSVVKVGSQTLTGVTGTVSVGTLGVVGQTIVALTGVRASIGTGTPGGASWGTSWGTSWGDSWGNVSAATLNSWGTSWGNSWGTSWGSEVVAGDLGIGIVLPSTEIVPTGVEVLADVGNLQTSGDRTAALTGVDASVAVGFVTAQNDVLVILTAIGQPTAYAGTVKALRIQALSGLNQTAAVGTIAAVADREQALSGVAVTVSVLTVNRDAISLAGVGAVASAAVGSVEPVRIVALTSVSATAIVGHTPKEGDVVLDTVGVEVGAGVVGVLGVIPAMPVGNYRHVAPGPARNGRIRDLEELEREMALMEE